MSERTCSIEDCNDPYLARGWCRMHYARWRATGDPGQAAPLRRAAGSWGPCATQDCGGRARRNGLCNACSAKARRAGAGTCTIDECGSRADARGVCGKHYQQIRNGKLDHPAAAEIRRDTPCSIDDCELPVYARGLCNMHWSRGHRLGDPGEAQPRRRKYTPGQTCAIGTCPRRPRWAGYCESHARRFKRFDLTEDEFLGLIKRQNNRCAICKTAEPCGTGDWAIDHDHVTGQVRGLLCNRCNPAIGLLMDDPEIIAAAARYITKHRQMRLFGPAAQ